MRRLTGATTVTNPETGERETFLPGDHVPDWAVAAINNPSAWEDDDAPVDLEAEAAQDSPPEAPKASGGRSRRKKEPEPEPEPEPEAQEEEAAPLPPPPPTEE